MNKPAPKDPSCRDLVPCCAAGWDVGHVDFTDFRGHKRSSASRKWARVSCYAYHRTAAPAAKRRARYPVISSDLDL